MATKRGCEHDAPVDGSWFDDYVKEFTSAGLSATIRFTGSYLPEDKITCATGDLTLRNRYRTLALSLVPRYCWPMRRGLHGPRCAGGIRPELGNKTELV
jgi:hypothetical protein